MAVNISLLSSNNTNNIATNFNRVAAALQDTVGRSGTQPNQMNADLDMNNNDVLNIGTLEVDSLIVNGINLDEAVERTELAVIEAEVAADEAQQALADSLAMIVPNNSVSTVKIVDSAVTTPKITNEAVTVGKINKADAGAIANLLGDNLYISDIASTSIPSSIKIIRPVGFSVVDPLSTRWKRISTPSPAKAWHKQSVDGQWWELNDHIAHPFMFGNVANGQDDTAAFQRCIEWMKSAGPAPTGEMVVPNRAGHDYFISDVQISDWDSGQYRRKISGFGSVIRPYLGGSANGTLFKISNAPRVTMEGFQLLNTTSNNLDNCLYIQDASSYFVIREMVILGGGNPDEILVNIEQGSAGGHRGNFWGSIENCEIKGTGPNPISYGIRIYGQNNDMTIRKNHIAGSNRTSSVAIFIDAASGEMMNTMLLDNNDIGECVYGVYTKVHNADAIQGFRSVNGRFEGLVNAHVFEMYSGTAAANQKLPIIENNMYTDMSGSAIISEPSLLIDFKERRNPSGVATMASGASSVVVTFPWQEFNSQYTVTLHGANDPSLRVDAKGDAGFTIRRDGTTGAFPITWTLHPAYRA